MEHEDLFSVLRRAEPSLAEVDWRVEMLHDGKQARLFRVWPSRDANDLRVAKIYRDVPDALFAFSQERTGLVHLSKFLARQECEGWTLLTPDLLFVCESPRALLMSEVPGIQIDQILEEEDSITEVATIIFLALRKYWQCSASLYGDLTLKNVLCDIEARQISFVDPGAPLPHFECPDRPKRWYPASRDLAYLLFGVTTTNVKLSLTRPHQARRRLAFTVLLLKMFVETIASAEDRAGFRRELLACFDDHASRMEPTNLFHRVWQWIVCRVAVRQAQRIVKTQR